MVHHKISRSRDKVHLHQNLHFNHIPKWFVYTLNVRSTAFKCIPHIWDKLSSCIKRQYFSLEVSSKLSRIISCYKHSVAPKSSNMPVGSDKNQMPLEYSSIICIGAFLADLVRLWYLLLPFQVPLPNTLPLPKRETLQQSSSLTSVPPTTFSLTFKVRTLSSLRVLEYCMQGDISSQYSLGISTRFVW